MAIESVANPVHNATLDVIDDNIGNVVTPRQSPQTPTNVVSPMHTMMLWSESIDFLKKLSQTRPQ